MIIRESRPEYGIAVSAMNWIESRKRILASDGRREAMEVHEAQRAASLGLNASQYHRPELARWAVPPPMLTTKLAMPSPASSLVARPRLTARLEHAGSRVVLVV